MKKIKIKIEFNTFCTRGRRMWQQVDAFAYSISEDRHRLTLLVPVGNDLVEGAVVHYASGIHSVSHLGDSHE
jgi:hypothetical protein